MRHYYSWILKKKRWTEFEIKWQHWLTTILLIAILWIVYMLHFLFAFKNSQGPKKHLVLSLELLDRTKLSRKFFNNTILNSILIKFINKVKILNSISQKNTMPRSWGFFFVCGQLMFLSDLTNLFCVFIQNIFGIKWVTKFASCNTRLSSKIFNFQ